MTDREQRFWAVLREARGDDLPRRGSPQEYDKRGIRHFDEGLPVCEWCVNRSYELMARAQRAEEERARAPQPRAAPSAAPRRAAEVPPPAPPEAPPPAPDEGLRFRLLEFD